MNAKLNKRERRAAALLAHYATCERLAAYLGHPNPDGKKISAALWKAEQLASRAATAYCNGTGFFLPDYPERGAGTEYRFGAVETDWDDFRGAIKAMVAKPLTGGQGDNVPGLRVNGYARGYALKIDPENQQGAELIAAVGLEKDWGGYGILSPEITGD